MKRITLIMAAVLLVAVSSFAGGIVTNTNQSAAWVRTLVRDASVDVDAVFYNLAGLTHLEDGFYVQINSQTAIQSRTITNDNAGLNLNEFIGETFVPVLPTGFLVYKKGNLALSAGFTFIGGGGSAEFNDGLPGFESMVAGVLPQTAAFGSTAYDADIYFKGTSAYMGIQLGASYKINDMISVGLGGRYIIANNAYDGYIKNIQINPTAALSYGVGDGTMTSAPEFFTDLSTTLTGLAAQANGAVTAANGASSSIQGIVDLGGGNYTFAQLVGVGYITADQQAQLEGGLVSFGMDAGNVSAMTAAQAQAAYDGYAAGYTTAAAQATAGAAAATGGAAGTQDVNVEAAQAGTGFTPIISVDLTLLDGDLGIALKYEHKTTMEVTNETTVDGSGMFPDGKVTPAEMPAFLSLGVRYQIMDNLKVQAGFHYYMDMDANYGKVDFNTGDFVTNGTEFLVAGVNTSYLEGNSYEIALGLEYALNETMGFSAGFLTTAVNPNNIYQSELSYALNTNTFGLGMYYNMGNLGLDLGFSSTMYDVYEKAMTTVAPIITETYTKNAMLIALGVSYKF